MDVLERKNIVNKLYSKFEPSDRVELNVKKKYQFWIEASLLII